LNVVAGQSSSSKPDSAWSWVRASIICALSLTALLGCSSGGELPQPLVDEGPPEVPSGSGSAKELRLPFLVDDYFVPNGCFGDSDCGGGVINIDSHGCEDPPATVQSVCRVYTYTPLAKGAPGWKGFLGILFQDVGPDGESGIGRVPGLPVQPGAQRVVFWAKLRSGSLDMEFRAGGANNWNDRTDPSLPYKDDFGVPQPVTLSKDYQQIAIDLSGVTYKDVVSPFGWSIESKGRTEPIDLYIADVRWE
jgi:hypothetical protein